MDTAPTKLYPYCHTLSLHDALPTFGLHPGRDEEIAAAGIGKALPDPGGAEAIAVGLDRRAARRKHAHPIEHAPVGGERRGIETEAEGGGHEGMSKHRGSVCDALSGRQRAGWGKEGMRRGNASGSR